MNDKIQVLDYGYVRLIESYGKGDAGVPEAGIIEAARQSTQGSFKQWDPYLVCDICGTWLSNPKKGPIENHPLCWNCNVKWKEYPRGDEGLLSFLFNSNPQHSTPFEFAGCIIEVQCPIFVVREWHRHRSQFFNEMSARYAPIPNLNYLPSVERLFFSDSNNKQAQSVSYSQELNSTTAIDWLRGLEEVYEHAQLQYQVGLEIGIPKEVARICIPVGRYTRMRAGASLRNWLAFMTLRNNPKAQWETQEFARAVGQILEQEFPRVWNLFQKKASK